ncbi:hypothetical protein KJ693_00345 [bacterium]|nr:hypothetical protein [bacterium]MBU1613740.1 hypothetical protein [bacterium]
MEMIQEKDYKKVFDCSRENWRWFEDNRERLHEEYPEEFIIILEKRVVAHNSELDQALKELPSEYRDKEHLIELMSKEGIELVL